MTLEDTRRLYLFVTLRAIISAAVRLSICGPMQGQRIEAELSAQCIEPLLASPALQAQLVPGPLEDEVCVWRTPPIVAGRGGDAEAAQRVSAVAASARDSQGQHGV